MRFKRRFRLMESEGGGSGGGSAPAPAPVAPPEPEVFSATYVKELRAESSGYRLKAKEAQQRADAAEAKAKDAETAAANSVTEATTKAEQRIIRAELKAVAIKAGIVDLDGLKLVDLSTVKLDANGEVEGADALIETLKTSKPYLFGAPNSSSTATPPATPTASKKSAKDMTPEEYAAERKAMTRR